MKDEGERPALIPPSPGQDTRRDVRERNSRGIMAEGARFEASTDPRTIVPDSTSSFQSQSLTEDQEVGEDPMKPRRTR
jgi:hypothetical protein